MNFKFSALVLTQTTPGDFPARFSAFRVTAKRHNLKYVDSESTKKNYNTFHKNNSFLHTYIFSIHHIQNMQFQIPQRKQKAVASNERSHAIGSHRPCALGTSPPSPGPSRQDHPRRSQTVLVQGRRERRAVPWRNGVMYDGPVDRRRLLESLLVSTHQQLENQRRRPVDRRRIVALASLWTRSSHSCHPKS